jgi:hypothetical protein
MRIIPDQLRSKNLVPFKKRHGRYKIPGMTSENEILMDRVDPDLSPEEQSYIRHYLGYADAFIKMTEESTPPEAREVSFPESAPSSRTLSTEEGPKEGPKNQQTAGQPAASLVDESGPATNDNPVRAA